MSRETEKLLEAARRIKMSAEEQERQRRSFAYGNAGLENDLITRDMVDQQAEKLKSETDG